MEESSAFESSMSSPARCASDPRGAALPPVAGEEAPVASSLVNTTGLPPLCTARLLHAEYAAATAAGRLAVAPQLHYDYHEAMKMLSLRRSSDDEPCIGAVIGTSAPAAAGALAPDSSTSTVTINWESVLARGTDGGTEPLPPGMLLLSDVAAARRASAASSTSSLAWSEGGCGASTRSGALRPGPAQAPGSEDSLTVHNNPTAWGMPTDDTGGSSGTACSDEASNDGLRTIAQAALAASAAAATAAAAAAAATATAAAAAAAAAARDSATPALVSATATAREVCLPTLAVMPSAVLLIEPSGDALAGDSDSASMSPRHGLGINAGEQRAAAIDLCALDVVAPDPQSIAATATGELGLTASAADEMAGRPPFHKMAPAGPAAKHAAYGYAATSTKAATAEALTGAADRSYLSALLLGGDISSSDGGSGCGTDGGAARAAGGVPSDRPQGARRWRIPAGRDVEGAEGAADDASAHMAEVASAATLVDSSRSCGTGRTSWSASCRQLLFSQGSFDEDAHSKQGTINSMVGGATGAAARQQQQQPTTFTTAANEWSPVRGRRGRAARPGGASHTEKDSMQHQQHQEQQQHHHHDWERQQQSWSRSSTESGEKETGSPNVAAVEHNDGALQSCTDMPAAVPASRARKRQPSKGSASTAASGAAAAVAPDGMRGGLNTPSVTTGNKEGTTTSTAAAQRPWRVAHAAAAATALAVLLAALVAALAALLLMPRLGTSPGMEGLHAMGNMGAGSGAPAVTLQHTATQARDAAAVAAGGAAAAPARQPGPLTGATLQPRLADTPPLAAFNTISHGPQSISRNSSSSSQQQQQPLPSSTAGKVRPAAHRPPVRQQHTAHSHGAGLYTADSTPAAAMPQPAAAAAAAHVPRLPAAQLETKSSRLPAAVSALPPADAPQAAASSVAVPAAGLGRGSGLGLGGALPTTRPRSTTLRTGFMSATASGGLNPSPVIHPAVTKPAHNAAQDSRPAATAAAAVGVGAAAPLAVAAVLVAGAGAAALLVASRQRGALWLNQQQSSGTGEPAHDGLLSLDHTDLEDDLDDGAEGQAHNAAAAAAPGQRHNRRRRGGLTATSQAASSSAGAGACAGAIDYLWLRSNRLVPRLSAVVGGGGAPALTQLWLRGRLITSIAAEAAQRAEVRDLVESSAAVAFSRSPQPPPHSHGTNGSGNTPHGTSSWAARSPSAAAVGRSPAGRTRADMGTAGSPAARLRGNGTPTARKRDDRAAVVLLGS